MPHKISRGFTLSEIMIVISVLAILGLSTLIAINPMLQIFKGYDARRKADLHDLKTAFESYYADHDCYPTAEILNNCGGKELSPYLDFIPCDPTSHKPYTLYLGLDQSTTCPQAYSLYASLSNTHDPEGNRITFCPNIIAQTSPNALYVNTVRGCSGQQICRDLYGCSQGSCKVLFKDAIPTCGFTYCTPDCGGVNCAQKKRGLYVNDCR